MGVMADQVLSIHPLTAKRWTDLVELFERPGPRGAWSRTGACYCMFWRLEPAAYEAAFRQRSLDNVTGGPNKKRMGDIVSRDAVPGLLAYRGGQPVGWVSAGPRSAFAQRLANSAGLRPDEETDDQLIWSINCFYVHRSEWRSGVADALLEAAVRRAAKQGATVVEGYPVKAGSIDPYTGYDTMFARAGFALAKPGRGKGRALWRRELGGLQRV